MPTIREVAKKAGVSIATVSRVMNGHHSVNAALRERVMKVVDACDYVPTVGRKSLGAIALVYIGKFSVGSPYDSACIDGMALAMRASPFDLTLIDLHRDKSTGESLRQFFTRKGICGAVLRCADRERAEATQLAAEGVPLVVLGDHFEAPNVVCIWSDSTGASREAVDYLCSLGHSRIGFATSDLDDGDHVDRYEAFRGSLETRGLLQGDLVWRIPPHRLDGVQLMRAVMGMHDRPTALFIADPLVAIGAMNEAHRMQVGIPQDISIISVDDTDARNSVYPKLTAVCQDATQLGRLAFEQIVRKVSGTPTSVPLPTAWFEINDTTGTPPTRVDRVLPSGARLD